MSNVKEIPALIKKHACTCGNCQAGLVCSYNQSIWDSFPNLARDSHSQKTFGGAALLDATEQAAAASISEIDQAISRLESLKLADLIRKRAALESAMDDAHRALREQQMELARLQRGITSMIERGVQS